MIGLFCVYMLKVEVHHDTYSITLFNSKRVKIIDHVLSGGLFKIINVINLTLSCAIQRIQIIDLERVQRMNMIVNPDFDNLKKDLVVREHLDFKLDASIPKYWYANDAFMTRFWGGVCATFPEGERYFISSLRPFRDQISDPYLNREVKDFMCQEGQHGVVHTEFNQILQEHGMPIDKLVKYQHKIFNLLLGFFSARYNLALTVACEHITALMMECFFGKKETMESVDYRVRAMLAWHSVEEVEHKAVAFDVMNAVKVSYFTRVSAMIFLIFFFTIDSLRMTNYFLKVDGFSFFQRMKMIWGGLGKLFGTNGMLAPMGKPFLRYFRRDFHPWQQPTLAHYQVWLDTYARTGDPIAAGEAFHQAAR